MNLMGMFSSRVMGSRMPPLAVPSSFVTMTPVRPTASWNLRACSRPFWPVTASRTSHTSFGSPWSALPMTRFTFLSSSIRLCCVCRRPAVSTMRRSVPRATRRCAPSKATAPGSVPSGPVIVGLSSGEHDRAAGGAVVAAQLGDGGGLADAVHAHHHDHVAGRFDLMLGYVQLEADAAQLLAHAVRFELIQEGLLEGVTERHAPLAFGFRRLHHLGRDLRTHVRQIGRAHV